MSNIKLNNLFKTLQSFKFTKPTTITTSSTNPIPNGYKRSTPPIALPISKILTTKLFPYSIKESISDYQTRKDLDIAQDNLLSLLPFYQKQDHHHQDHSDRKAKVLKIPIGNDHYINEFCIQPQNTNYSELNHFVLIHGYGAGLGFFIKNFEEISQKNNWCIHSIDLLGYGCSSRPKFSTKHDLETWFVESLENWRIQRGIDKMLMCSHSLGAYMSLLYTNKYPNVVQKLMLISPAGIIKPLGSMNIPIWFNYLWDQNVSPFALVRNSGPFGSLITSGWTSRRFAKFTQREQILLHKYTYAIFNAPGSGEYFMSKVLSAGGIPRFPLVEKIDKLVKCDTVWCYGDEDWMPKEGGLQSVDKIHQNTPYKAFFKTIKNSGHHIYLDNYKDFNGLILDEMKNYESTYLNS